MPVRGSDFHYTGKICCKSRDRGAGRRHSHEDSPYSAALPLRKKKNQMKCMEKVVILTKDDSVAAVYIIRNIATLRIWITVFENQSLGTQFFFAYSSRTLVIQVALLRVWIETGPAGTLKILSSCYT